MASGKKTIIFVYNLLLFIFILPALLIFALRYRRRFFKEFIYHWRERLGKVKVNGRHSDGRPLIWVHCASIGEVRAAEPLLGKLKDYRILLTVHTLSGRNYALQKNLAGYILFAPLDFTFFLNSFLKSFAPSALILVETEFWPGMILAAKRMGCKVLVVNGRLSGNSLKYYYATRAFWKKILSNIDYISARSEEDAGRFKLLGYPGGQISISGNIKYDRSETPVSLSRKDIGFGTDDIIIVAGSTRSDEEGIVVGCWQSLRKKYPRVKLVIAPRHLNRIGAVSSLLEKKGVTFSLYSQNNGAVRECVILDTFGELYNFYSLSDIAFVGGSIVDKGGQNPIEPAAYSKPVVFGPFMHNFSSEASGLLNCGGAISVSSAEELEQAFEKLVSNESLREKMGRNALKMVSSQKGAVERTLVLINNLLHYCQATRPVIPE